MSNYPPPGFGSAYPPPPPQPHEGYPPPGYPGGYPPPPPPPHHRPPHDSYQGYFDNGYPPPPHYNYQHVDHCHHHGDPGCCSFFRGWYAFSLTSKCCILGFQCLVSIVLVLI
ncbi:hypothetical protein RYX36_009076 [Vicia faba]